MRGSIINYYYSSSGFAAPPSFVSNTAPQQPFQYPNIGGAGPSPNISAPPPFSYNIPPSDPQHDNSSAPPPYFPPEVQKQDLSLENPVAPGPSDGAAAKAGGGAGHLDLPELPPVPSDTPLGGNTPQVEHSASFLTITITQFLLFRMLATTMTLILMT